MSDSLFDPPRTPKQERLERARRRLHDLENPLRAALTLVTSIEPSEINPRNFTDIQLPLLDTLEQIRRFGQEMRELLAYLGTESTPEQDADEKAKAERIEIQERYSMERWRKIQADRNAGCVYFQPLADNP